MEGWQPTRLLDVGEDHSPTVKLHISTEYPETYGHPYVTLSHCWGKTKILRLLNDNIEAMKVTGDDYVPAGEITWWANLRTRRGQGRVAEHEFRNPRFVPGRIVIVDEHHVVFHWAGIGSVEYRRDD